MGADSTPYARGMECPEKEKMTLGYAVMLQDMGITVGPTREWPINWIDFRPHPCPHWSGVQLYRDRIDKGLFVESVVICRECFSILDGWHRVAAYWLEDQKMVPVQLADRHIAGAEDCCRIGNLDWIHTLRPWADLDCISGSYLEADWNVPAFSNVRDKLVAFGNRGPKMRLWERTRSVCFLGNVRNKIGLDIGTRDSLVPHWLAARGASMHAVSLDISQIVDDGAVEIHEGDVRSLPIEFVDDFLDFILCVAVLKSIPGWGDRRAVVELVRALRPGGLLAISIDFGQKYEECPGEITGVRTYNTEALYERIIRPSRCELVEPVDFDRSDWNAWPIRSQSPRAYAAGLNIQVAFILLRKPT